MRKLIDWKYNCRQALVLLSQFFYRNREFDELSNALSHHGWVLTLFDTYPQGTVFKPQYHHPWNEVTNGSVVSNDSFVSY